MVKGIEAAASTSVQAANHSAARDEATSLPGMGVVLSIQDFVPLQPWQ